MVSISTVERSRRLGRERAGDAFGVFGAEGFIAVHKSTPCLCSFDCARASLTVVFVRWRQVLLYPAEPKRFRDDFGIGGEDRTGLGQFVSVVARKLVQRGDDGEFPIVGEERFYEILFIP